MIYQQGKKEKEKEEKENGLLCCHGTYVYRKLMPMPS
jgi:hypothetical protein